MPKAHDLLSEKRTHLAQKRTELAYERTMMAYVRTASTVILFGLAFIGFSAEYGQFFYYVGLSSIGVGVFLILIAIRRGRHHMQEMVEMSHFFHKLIKFKFKKKKR